MPSSPPVESVVDHALQRAAALADPDRLYALAARLHAHADAVRADAARLGHRLSGLSWHGPAATAFHERAHATLAALHRAAGRVDDAGVAMRVHADTVSTVAGEVRRTVAVAVDAVDALARHLPGGW